MKVNHTKIVKEEVTILYIDKITLYEFGVPESKLEEFFDLVEDTFERRFERSNESYKTLKDQHESESSILEKEKEDLIILNKKLLKLMKSNPAMLDELSLDLEALAIIDKFEL